MVQHQNPITTELLLQVHDIRFPIPKASKLDWQQVWDLEYDTPPDSKQLLFRLMKPVWLQLSKRPVPFELPSPTDDKYLEQCMALTWIYDQCGTYFRGKDIRWDCSYFRPIADKIALAFWHAEESPFKKETWLKRGWTFDDYVYRMVVLWEPLAHSEQIVRDHWNDIHKVIILDLRKSVEEYTGIPDPGALTQEQDERDVELFDRLFSHPPASVKDMTGMIYTMIRIITAHYPVIHRFGRYPYRNDLVGRDFQPGEKEWIARSVSFKRLDLATRTAIRKDVDAGRWSPLEMNYDID